MADIASITYTGGYTPAQSDTVADPSGPFAAFYVGGAGAVKIHAIDGNDLTFTAPVVGQIINCAGTRVWSTGTTATAILCLQAMPGYAKPRTNP